MFQSVKYTLPANEQKGLGNIILTPTSENLIPGVQVNPYILWPDDRGYFLEIARMCNGSIRDFPAESTQISAAMSLPGTIKAFHVHCSQTDYWAPIAGMFQVALVDLRPDSSAFGLRNTLYIGTLRPWQLLIPPGIGHGYKVISKESGLLVYLTNRFYNPEDEGRIPHDDKSVNYCWDLQHK